MDTTRRFPTLVAVLAVLLITGFSTVLGVAYGIGQIGGNAADGEYGMVYVAAVVIFASLSPSLLLPYVVLFWRKPGRAAASIISAMICGVFYPLLIGLLFAATSSVNLDPGDLAGWGALSALALIPGTLLALLGTYFGQGLRSRSLAVRSKSPPG